MLFFPLVLVIALCKTVFCHVMGVKGHRKPCYWIPLFACRLFSFKLSQLLYLFFSFHFLYHSQSVLTRHFVIRFYTCKARHKVLWNLNSLSHTHRLHKPITHTLHPPVPVEIASDGMYLPVWGLVISWGFKVQTILIFFLLSPCVHLLIGMILVFSSRLFPPSFPLPIFSSV